MCFGRVYSFTLQVVQWAAASPSRWGCVWHQNWQRVAVARNVCAHALHSSIAERCPCCLLQLSVPKAGAAAAQPQVGVIVGPICEAICTQVWAAAVGECSSFPQPHFFKGGAQPVWETSYC